MVHQVSSALNTSISKFTDLFRVVTIPSSTVKIAIKVLNELGMDEVGKGIADVAGVVVING